MGLTASVVVITYARPDYVQECLTHLRASRTAPLEVIVVDGSPDDRTARLLADEFGEARLIRHHLGRGTMPESRQLGFAAATGDVVAFIDDDAYVYPDWLDEILAPYDDPAVVGVGGRAVNGIPGEEHEGLGRIGRLLPNGDLTGFFGADPGRELEVDHLLGATMSFRRATLAALGGIRGRYPGTCLCEESDISLRLRAAGGRLVFNPRAVVRHVAAPYTTGGQRFDRRYLYYARRNHVVLLARVYGWRSPLVRRYAWTTVRAQAHYARIARDRLLRPHDDGRPRSARERARFVLPLTRSAVEVAGLVAGFPAAAAARRHDRAAGVATP